MRPARQSQIGPPGKRSARTATPPTLVGRLGGVGTAALVAFALTFGVLWFISSRTSQWVRHSRDVARLARETLLLSAVHELAHRDPDRAGNASSPSVWAAQRSELWSQIDSSIALTADNPAQHANARAVATAAREWERAANPVTRAGTAAATATRIAVSSAREFERLHEAIRTLIAAEEVLYAARVSRNRTIGRVFLTVMLVELLALAGAFLLKVRQLSRQTHQVMEQQVQLEEQAAEVRQQLEEAQVLTEELESANQELHEENALRLNTEHAVHLAHERERGTNRLLDFVLESAPIGLAVVDLSMRYERINGAMARMMGQSPQSLVGRTPSEAVPHLGHIVEPVYQRVLATGQPEMNFEISGAMPDAPTLTRHWLGNYYPVRSDTGDILGVGTVIVETTERRQLEAQLLQSQKMEAVGLLAGGVAHDFNNLLTVILSYSTMAIELVGPAHALRGDLEEIQLAAQRAAALTRQLLAFSRKQDLQPRVLDVNVVVRSVERMLARLIGEDIELSLSLSKDIGPVYADPGQLEQVIMNLAVNARDAMRDGGRLLIETGEQELSDSDVLRHIGVPAGTYAMLAVSDTGTGMSPQTIAQIFEPFFTTKPLGAGTGLGLSSVYGIVKQSGGDIWVYSEPGIGTTFKVYLPLMQDSAALPTRRATPANGRPAIGVETVLLVEDDAALRTLGRRVLESRGFTVLVAASGDEALSLANTHTGDINLVATDMVMPGMSGRSVVQYVVELHPRAKILFMSGYTNDDVLSRGVVQPAAAFLQKPFTPEQLAYAVRGVLDDA